MKQPIKKNRIMAAKKNISTVKELINLYSESKDPTNILRLQMLEDNIKIYNENKKILDTEGYIVEAYKQKYVHPSFKLMKEAQVQILKIIKQLIDYNKTEVGDTSKEELIQSLLL